MITKLGGQRPIQRPWALPAILMKPTFITIVCATLLAVGATCWLSAGEPPRKTPYPKATPPPPPSPIYTPSRERAPTAREIARDARNHNEMLAKAIERSLVARNPQQRETAFTFLLPELLQVEPAACGRNGEQAGARRDARCAAKQVAQTWITSDREAAVAWIRSLEGSEQRDTAEVAVSTLAAYRTRPGHRGGRPVWHRA